MPEETPPQPAPVSNEAPREAPPVPPPAAPAVERVKPRLGLALRTPVSAPPPGAPVAPAAAPRPTSESAPVAPPPPAEPVAATPPNAGLPRAAAPSAEANAAGGVVIPLFREGSDSRKTTLTFIIFAAVVVFGGDAEITATTIDHDPRVAGVISTDPAYLMNAATTGQPVALTGRVPCHVQGPVDKGDLLVTSNIPGVAQRLVADKFRPGCVIGKSLERIDHDEIKLIEVVVGRY